MPLTNSIPAVLTTGNQSIAGTKTFSDSTVSTNNATGAVVVTGGLGVGGNIHLGTNIFNNHRIIGNLILGTSDGSSSHYIYGATIVSRTLTTAGRKSAISTKSANYTTVVTDEFILVDATSAARTITLLSAATAGAGAKITIIKTDASANTVTVTPVLSNGVLTTQYLSTSFVSNGTSWFSY